MRLFVRIRGAKAIEMFIHFQALRETIPPSLGQQLFHRATDPSQGTSQTPSVLHSQVALKVSAILHHIAPSCQPPALPPCVHATRGQSNNQTMPNANPEPEAHWERLGMAGPELRTCRERLTSVLPKSRVRIRNVASAENKTQPAPLLWKKDWHRVRHIEQVAFCQDRFAW